MVENPNENKGKLEVVKEEPVTGTTTSYAGGKKRRSTMLPDGEYAFSSESIAYEFN